VLDYATTSVAFADSQKGLKILSVALVSLSSPPDGTRPGDDGSLITDERYAGPSSMVPVSLPDGTLDRHTIGGGAARVRYAYRTYQTLPVSVSRAGFPLQLLQSYHWLIIELGLIVRCVLQTL